MRMPPAFTCGIRIIEKLESHVWQLHILGATFRSEAIGIKTDETLEVEPIQISEKRSSIKDLGYLREGPINEFLQENKLDGRLKERELIRNWEEVTGKMVARATHSIYIKNRTLFVEVRSSFVKNKLLMIQDGLIQALNSSVNEELIDKIVIQ